MGDGPGRRLRKNVANVRRHVDYVSNILNHYEVCAIFCFYNSVKTRLWQYGRKQRIVQQPDELYQVFLFAILFILFTEYCIAGMVYSRRSC